MDRNLFEDWKKSPGSNFRDEACLKKHVSLFRAEADRSEELHRKIESGELRGGASPEEFKKRLANSRGYFRLVADDTEQQYRDVLASKRKQPSEPHPFHEPPSSTGSHPTITNSTLSASSTFSGNPDAESTRLDSYRPGRHRVLKPTGRFGRTGGVLKGVANSKALGNAFPEWDDAPSDNTTKSVQFDMSHLEDNKENQPPARDAPRVSSKQSLDPAQQRPSQAPSKGPIGSLAARATKPAALTRPTAGYASRVLRPVSPKQPGTTHAPRGSLPASSTEPIASRPTRHGRSAMQARVEDDDASSILSQVAKLKATRAPEPELPARQASSGTNKVKEHPQSTLHSFIMPTRKSFPHLHALVCGTLKVTPCYKSPMSLFYQPSKIPARQPADQFLQRLPEDEADIFVSLDMILDEVASLKEHDEMLQQEADRLQQTVDTLQQEKAGIQRVVDQLTTNLADTNRALKADREALRQALELGRAHADDTQVLRDLELENLRLQESAKRHERMITETEQHNIQLRLMVATEKRDAASLRKRVVEVQRQATEDGQRIRDLEQENARLNQDIAEHTMDLAVDRKSVEDLQQRAREDEQMIRDLDEEIRSLKHQRATEDRIRRQVDQESRQLRTTRSSKGAQPRQPQHAADTDSSLEAEETLSDANMTSAFIVPDITLQADKQATATQSAALPTQDDCHVLDADMITVDGFDDGEIEMGEVVRAPAAASSSRAAPASASAPLVSDNKRRAPNPVLSHRRKTSAPADMDASRRVAFSEVQVEEKLSTKVTRSASGAYLSDSARHVLNELCEHECRNCSVCGRLGAHGRHESCKTTSATKITTTVQGKQVQKKTTLRIPRPTPVSDRDMPTTSSGFEPTVRPANSPGKALARVIKTVNDEYEHLKMEMDRTWQSYRTEDSSCGGRKSSKTMTLLVAKANELHRKRQQLYDLHDVVEGQKAAGQLMTEEEIEMTIVNIME